MLRNSKIITSAKITEKQPESSSWKSFASDGSILATTVMRYDIYLDFKSMKDTIYSNNIGALTDSLSKMFDKQEVISEKI
jgi:hypothetical protein